MEYMVKLMVSASDYNPADKQENHDSLADYLTEHFRQDGFVEFFGFFSGGAAQPARAHKQISARAIRHPQFHFHAGTLYRLMLP
jgi:hypothetical protein